MNIKNCYYDRAGLKPKESKLCALKVCYLKFHTLT